MESIWNSFTPTRTQHNTSKMLYYIQKYFSILNVKLGLKINCNGYVFQYFRKDGVLYMCIVKL